LIPVEAIEIQRVQLLSYHLPRARLFLTTKTSLFALFLSLFVLFVLPPILSGTGHLAVT
jgi:hypothetical protein